MKYKITEKFAYKWGNRWLCCSEEHQVFHHKEGTILIYAGNWFTNVQILIGGRSYRFNITPCPTELGLKRIAKRLLAEKLKELGKCQIEQK